MASFTTRVELHNADADDYEILHDAMEREGFKRTITSDEGVTYHLPDAEYDRSGELTKDAVLTSAKRAADKTRKSYGILVTESSGRTWTGLRKTQR